MTLTKVNPTTVFDYLIKHKQAEGVPRRQAIIYAVQKTWMVYNNILKFVKSNAENIETNNKYFNFNVEQIIKFEDEIREYWNDRPIGYFQNGKWFITKSPAFHVDVKYKMYKTLVLTEKEENIVFVTAKGVNNGIY